VALFLEVVLAALAAIDNASVVQGVQISVVIVGLVPNGLLVAVAVAYGLGAVRIARHGALVQQANAVESLASVDVLCLDKTGTLTANKIVLHAVRPLAGTAGADLRRLLGDFAASTPAGNRTSEAIAAACPGQPRRLGGEIPFSSARKWSALILDEPPQTGGYVLGAPEILAPALPHDLDLQAAEEWAAQGLRVLLFAAAPGLQAPPDAEQASLPPDLRPLGLISFTDELRPEARETLASFIAAGIRPKIISGDSPQTVAALAKQAGLSDDIQAISGLELATLGEAEFAQRAEDATIFGRITPQQKQALVKALRGRGHYVAMIGDGTNDVLSLKGPTSASPWRAAARPPAPWRTSCCSATPSPPCHRPSPRGRRSSTGCATTSSCS
jgi:cation-transporting ATPase E